jgi:prophage maintenance system killer protein
VDVDVDRLKVVVEEPLRLDEGRDVYPGVHLKAAALFLAMMRESPFDRGNARIALLATAVLLNLNGEDLAVEEGDLLAVVALGSNGDLSVLQVAAVIERLTERLGSEQPQG